MSYITPCDFPQSVFFGPEYKSWDDPTKIMFLEKQLFLTKKQMRCQERLADNHRSLLKAIQEDYKSTLVELRDKNRQLKELSTELRKTKEGLEKQVLRRTRELENNNINLKKYSRQLEHTNITLDVLLKKQEKERKALGEKVIENYLGRILPDLKSLLESNLNHKQKKLLNSIIKTIQTDNAECDFFKNKWSTCLSPSESNVAGLIAEGNGCQEVACQLNVSVRTVHSHCYRIRKKLNVPENTRLKDYLA